ncbi:peptidoglycan DD-metalloendopeptidase family protein [Teredinibacter sp. KSP-S5-2]|uniref:peptidoglycan DD-metalloendopeptidase family protein n=1 Tax=Teredinibacter sp. KSP-S5-2 TaxID=3034506 RepID=UPI002934D403|nr:peptidoglycan DD-metalloendopeptidase family protein [Teredinibacter sp. KSP-S5-2]WNO11702.1 peptidoglycan DD-metalloendopeptidase family protein [Teredinibacter sp. KSP-S5-2]
MFFLIDILIVSFLLSSCGQTTHYAPLHEFEQPPSKKLNYHVVTKGETLYSIAWRYNLDYRALARINGIDANYTIHPGLRIKLAGVPTKQPWSAGQVTKVTPEVTPAIKVEKPPAQKLSNRSIKGTKKQTPTIKNHTGFGAKEWVWPARGKLLSTFKPNDSLNKGIDIKTNLGEPVLAAAAGEIVYSGNGLRGYGKLLIIKHSEKFLSAYAHNRKLLVKEGAKVKAGQKIAEAGSSGTDSVKLHFEIRYDGKPVDPLKYLPK